MSIAAASSAAVPAPKAVGSPIKHVVEIMLENHTFDDLFGHFRGADGIPAGTKFINPAAEFDPAPAVRPITGPANEGNVGSVLDNSTVAEQMAMDYAPGGRYLMDHYTTFPSDGLAAITTFPASTDPNDQYLARHFELADRNFQPGIEPSNPNIHWALNGTDNGWKYNSLQPGTSNATWHSIFKEVDAHGLTSKLYYGLPQGSLSQFWYQMFPTDRPQDVTTDTQFYSDLTNNQLPSFSMVRPDYNDYSEGDGGQDIEQGDAWLGQVVQAIADSPEWKSTAVFITYDEGGGFWDHMSPPVKGTLRYGTRTPMVIVSPYAKPGVFDEQTTNVSILSFVQRLWGLKPLTAMNADQNDLLGAFDFHQRPLPVPTLPQVPSDTIAFYDTPSTPAPGTPISVNLQANTPALTLDPTISGPVTLKVTPPKGVAVPAGFPTSVTMQGGKVSFTASFSQAGYYRIQAVGAGGSEGWTTVDVGVTPDTIP